MHSVIKQIMKTATGSTLRSFDEQCRSLGDTQSRVLSRLVSRNASSAFGRDHGLAGIKTLSDFQRAVPVCSYEDLQPYIDRSLNGEAGQLTAERPVMFATTSGTTGTPKYIPVTPTSKASKSKLMRVWLGSLFKDHPGTLDGKILAVVSPEVESYSPGGIPCGAESGHGYRAMSPAVRAQYTAPYEVCEISDYEARYYALVRIACGHSISMIYACNPSTVLLLAQKMGAHTEQIIKDVRDGTLSSNFDIAPELRQIIEPLLVPDQQRATELEAAAYRGNGRLLPRTVWPELACIASWKGGTVSMYLDKFADYFDAATSVRDIGYFASELRGTVVLTDEGSSGVLSVTENLYEFAPADGAKPSGGELLLPHQLEQGGQYFIYVTTMAGLYRYEMNDLMEVTGFYGQTPIMRFLQKGKGMVSFTGEKLSESQVINAVERGLADRRGAFEFIAAVGEVPGDKPRYAFLVEFDQPPGDDEEHRMLRGIEDALCELNLEYAAKRKSLRIDAPVLRTIRSGAFDDYRRRQVVEKGRMDGQFKTLRLTTDTAFADEFEVEGEIALQH